MRLNWVIIAFLCTISVNARDLFLSGKVVDYSTNQELPGA